MPDRTTFTSKLQAKRVLIVGGTSGIGFGAAAAALESGAVIRLSSSSPDKLAKAEERLRIAYPSRVASILPGIATNLSDDATLEAQLDVLLNGATAQGAEKLDHVIYTAGDKLATGPLANLTLAAVKKAGNVRYFAPLLLAARLPRYMHSSADSSLTLTTGSVADRPHADWAAVAGFASGLHGLTRGLALDLKPIRVNLVSPGYVETEMWDHMGDDRAQAMRESLTKRNPTGRVGRPEDLAESYLYLMKDANATGQIVRSESGGLLV